MRLSKLPIQFQRVKRICTYANKDGPDIYNQYVPIQTVRHTRIWVFSLSIFGLNSLQQKVNK